METFLLTILKNTLRCYKNAVNKNSKKVLTSLLRFSIIIFARSKGQANMPHRKVRRLYARGQKRGHLFLFQTF